jgi:hypothetical protein
MHNVTPVSFHELKIICDGERRVRLALHFVDINVRRDLGQCQSAALSVDFENTLYKLLAATLEVSKTFLDAPSL